MPVLTIVGAGLIGCSFAGAIRPTGVFERILAVEPSARNAQRALALGHVDGIVEDVATDSVVLLSCPADQVPGWLARLAGHSGIVFDTASVKGAVIEQARSALGNLPARFVPTHPIAGRETSGPDSADASLFVNRMVIITPAPETAADALEQVTGWWRATGARVSEMDPEVHDRIYALTSHLPHLLAFAYLQGIEPEHLTHSGGGFRDFSRIGASDPQMWSAIFDLNRVAVLEELARFKTHLEAFSNAIANGDTAACEQLIDSARSRRRDFPGD